MAPKLLRLAFVVIALCCLAATPAAAHVTASSDMRGPIPPGATQKLGTLTVLNEDPQGPDFLVCNAGECGGQSQGITLIPSCGALGAGGDCTAVDPGVFSIHPAAIGGVGTACTGMAFTASQIAPGRYSFNPAPGQRIVLPPLFRCRIEFRFDLLRTPATDSRPDEEGLQTSQVAEVHSTENLMAGTPAFDRATNSVTFGVAPPRPSNPAPPPTGAQTDRTPPVLSALSLSPARFRSAVSGGAIVSAPVGTSVRYRLSEAATVRFRVERARRGRRVGGRCVRTRRANRSARRCLRYVRVRGSFVQAGRAGGNAVRFRGRLGGRRLARGSYRLRAVASDASGNTSTAAPKRFRIVRR